MIAAAHLHLTPFLRRIVFVGQPAVSDTAADAAHGSRIVAELGHA